MAKSLTWDAGNIDAGNIDHLHISRIAGQLYGAVGYTIPLPGDLPDLHREAEWPLSAAEKQDIVNGTGDVGLLPGALQAIRDELGVS